MAQNFRRYTLNGVGTAAADIPDGTNFDSYDTLVGIHVANVTIRLLLRFTLMTAPTTSIW